MTDPIRKSASGKSAKASYDDHVRPARMRIKSTALISRGEQSHPTDLVDISATGLMVRRPPGWQGVIGECWVMDLIFASADLHIHMEGTVARIAERQLAFAYSRIPEDKQAPLWELLGGYADILERWDS